MYKAAITVSLCVLSNPSQYPIIHSSLIIPERVGEYYIYELFKIKTYLCTNILWF